MIRTLCMAFFALAVFAVTPAAAQPVLPDTGIADLDEYNPNAQLGAHGVYVGLVVTPTDRRANPVRLLVYVPPVAADSLCIELISYDGLYNGRFRFKPPRTPGWVFLDLPTRKGDVLRGYGTERLAPLAHLGPVCGEERGMSLPAGWGAARADQRLRLLVNVEGAADWVFTDWADDATRPFPCHLLGHAGRVAYAYSCDIHSPLAYGATELRIVQMDGLDPHETILVPVWVPRGL